MFVGPKPPFAFRLERQMRKEDADDCDYCNRLAHYMIHLGDAEDRLGFESEYVCNICFEKHYPDAEVAATLRQSGARSEGRWGDHP